jgi:cytochrome b involved in lipid metabolism
MPPDADKLRQRHVTAKDDPATATATTTTTTTIRSVKDLKGNEIVIDGIIYDLTNFYHPGGEQINVFGGNDVTIHYKMIHPYHTVKHLEKMTAIGKVDDFRIEYVSQNVSIVGFFDAQTHCFTRSATDISSIQTLSEKSNAKFTKLSLAGVNLGHLDGFSAPLVTLPSSLPCSFFGSFRVRQYSWLLLTVCRKLLSV